MQCTEMVCAKLKDHSSIMGETTVGGGRGKRISTAVLKSCSHSARVGGLKEKVGEGWVGYGFGKSFLGF